MDVLQDILRAKQYEVLRNFPDPAKVSRLGEDLSRFSEPYEFLRKQGEGCRLTLHDGYFNTQINMLHKHVTICLRLLDHIFSAGNADATPVTKLYQDLWRDEPLPPVRRRDTRGGTGYSHIAGRVAELALVWRDGLTPDNVQLILSAGWREQLAELKVSCAVACLRARRKPVKAP
jgi:hypothetical protein